jgi:hypothetical protein
MLRWQIVPTNALEEAIAVFGGVREFAEAIGITRARGYDWLELGYVPVRDKAIRLSEMLLKKGRAIPAAKLMALDATPEPARVGDKRSRAQRGVRPFQKKVETPSLVQPIDRSEPAVGQMAPIEGGRQLRVAMVKRAPHVLEWLAAMEQHRREPVSEAVRGHGFLKTG